LEEKGKDTKLPTWISWIGFMELWMLRERKLRMKKRTRLGTGKSTVVQLSLIQGRKVPCKVNNSPTELDEQIRLCVWLDRAGIKYYAIPNGGWRSAGEAVKFKLSGVKPGVPDLCIPLPVSHYHGLYIELKRVIGGKVSDVQGEWLNYLQSKGYFAVVAKGFDEAKGIVEYYLSLAPQGTA